MGGSTELLNIQAQCCCKALFVRVIFINLQVKSLWCDRQSEKMACGGNSTQQDPCPTDPSFCGTRS